jgi:hypothetical protein
VLLMTLFMPDLNYGKSYALPARQIATELPPDVDCIDSNVGPAQRASFAYFGKLPFRRLDTTGRCHFLLVQDSVRARDAAELDARLGHAGGRLLWEGRRPSDRDERFRLYRRNR